MSVSWCVSVWARTCAGVCACVRFSYAYFITVAVATWMDYGWKKEREKESYPLAVFVVNEVRGSERWTGRQTGEERKKEEIPPFPHLGNSRNQVAQQPFFFSFFSFFFFPLLPSYHAFLSISRIFHENFFVFLLFIYLLRAFFFLLLLLGFTMSCTLPLSCFTY